MKKSTENACLLGGLALLSGVVFGSMKAWSKYQDLKDDYHSLKDSKTFHDYHRIKRQLETNHALLEGQSKELKEANIRNKMYNLYISNQAIPAFDIGMQIARRTIEQWAGRHAETKDLLTKYTTNLDELADAQKAQMIDLGDSTPMEIAEILLQRAIFYPYDKGINVTMDVEGLNCMDSRSLQVLLSRVDQDILVIVMKYYMSTNLKDRVMAQLSNRLASMLQEDMDYMSDIEIGVRKSSLMAFIKICYQLWANKEIMLYPQVGI